MLAEPPSDVEARSRAALQILPAAVAGRVRVVSLSSVVGGGAAPGQEIPSAGWALEGPAHALDEALRGLPVPLIGRVVEDSVTIDFRTILPGEEQAVGRAVSEVLSAEAARE